MLVDLIFSLPQSLLVKLLPPVKLRAKSRSKKNLCTLSPLCTLLSLLSFLSLSRRETEIARRDEEEEKRPRDEFPSSERRIGGDGKRVREKRKEERKTGGEEFLPLMRKLLCTKGDEESFFRPLSLAAAEEKQDYSDGRTFRHAHARTRARGNLRERVCKRDREKEREREARDRGRERKMDPGRERKSQGEKERRKKREIEWGEK